MRNPIPPVIALVIIALVLVPTAQAAWTTSAEVPDAFRPNRDVAFTYHAESTSGVDAPLQWRITLHTCQDANENGWCESTEPSHMNHGQQTLSILGGQSGSQSWTVNLPGPEGTYLYHFHTACANNPCTTLPAGGAHNKTGTFQLRYTDTWQREIITSNPTSAGSSQQVTYQLTSTSADDRDFAGTAELYTTAPTGTEISKGAQPYTALASATTTLSWDDVTFTEIGTHTLRIADGESGDTTLQVNVRGVHLHAVQPRDTYTAGNRFGLYFTLEGHDASPGPEAISGAQIKLVVRNQTFIVHEQTLTMGDDGLAYAEVGTAEDHASLMWSATTSVTWHGTIYTPTAEGKIHVAPPRGGAELVENISAIRNGLDDLQLKGVHLDELGSRHVFLTSVRAVGAVALVIILVLLVIYIAIRV